MTRPTSRPASRSVAFHKRVRRQVLAALLTLAGWSLIAALFMGGGYLELHLAIDAIVGCYILFLVEDRRRRAERATKVRNLPPRAARPNDILLYDTWSAVEEA